MRRHAKSGLTAVEVVAVIAVLALAVGIFAWVYQRYIRPGQIDRWLDEQPGRLLSLAASAAAPEELHGDWLINVRITNTSSEYLPLIFTLNSFFLLTEENRLIPLQSDPNEDLRLADTDYFLTDFDPGQRRDFMLKTRKPPETARVIYVPRPFVADIAQAATNPPAAGSKAWAIIESTLGHSTLKSELLMFSTGPNSDTGPRDTVADESNQNE